MPSSLEQEVMKMYRLPEEQVQSIKETIIRVMAKDIVPSKRPLAIVVGGQSGAGKTALINYTSGMSTKREFVQIDNDFFRGFHPQADEIKEKYPDLYTAATDQMGLEITSDIIEYFKNNHYNIILHQTLKNNRIADDAMTKFREAGYTVGVRAFAVPYLESKMSQIERCEGQIEKLGFCRYVRQQDHDAAIEGLPKTVGYIEDSGKYDFIEIFKRGKKISEPQLVYSKFNPQTEQETLEVLSDCENVSHENHSFGFTSAQDAVERTRAEEALKVAKTLDERIAEAESRESNNEEMQTHIDELKLRFMQFKVEQGLVSPEEANLTEEGSVQVEGSSLQGDNGQIQQTSQTITTSTEITSIDLSQPPEA